jgi:hypothetical protein
MSSCVLTMNTSHAVTATFNEVPPPPPGPTGPAPTGLTGGTGPTVILEGS